MYMGEGVREKEGEGGMVGGIEKGEVQRREREEGWRDRVDERRMMDREGREVGREKGLIVIHEGWTSGEGIGRRRGQAGRKP